MKKAERSDSKRKGGAASVAHYCRDVVGWVRLTSIYGKLGESIPVGSSRLDATGLRLQLFVPMSLLDCFYFCIVQLYLFVARERELYVNNSSLRELNNGRSTQTALTTCVWRVMADARTARTARN